MNKSNKAPGQFLAEAAGTGLNFPPRDFIEELDDAGTVKNGFLSCTEYTLETNKSNKITVLFMINA